MAGTPVRGEAGRGWASVGLADHANAGSLSLEKWKIMREFGRSRDMIRFALQNDCSVCGVENGLEGARVGKGDQVGARSHRAGAKRYGGRDGRVWPDSRERNKSKIYSPRTT